MSTSTTSATSGGAGTTTGTAGVADSGSAEGTVGTAGPAPEDGVVEVPDAAGLDALAVGTSGLTKRFRGGQVAVADLALAVPRGSVYGFLGPNGSGKTTTIRMLLGLIAPTAGTAHLLGEPVTGGRAARARVLPRVGALVEGPAFHPYLTGEQNLRRSDAADRTVDARTSAARIAAALERVGLSAAADKRYRVYSLGMKQRLGLAAALLRPRDLLVLDEPTNGLDPQGTREVRALVRELAAEGTTIMVSTHLLAEVEQLCSHVGVMSGGRMVAQGTLDGVTAGTATRVRVECREPALAAQVLTRAELAAVTTTDDGASAELRAAGSASGAVGAAAGDAERVLAALVAAGAGVSQFTTQRSTLEDLFVSLTGEGFDVRA